MKISCIAMVTASSVLAGGCSTSFPRNTPGTTYGLIMVGSPRVESNDRLVNERRQHEAWLVEQLAEVRKGTYGFAGLTGLTSSAYLSAQANLSLDPQFRTDSIVRSRQRQAELAALRDDADIAGIRSRRIADIQARAAKGEITPKQACDELAEVDADCKVKAAANPSSTASAISPASAPASTYLQQQEKSRLDPPPREELKPTQLTLSPLEVFQRRLDAANEVQELLQTLRGDDVHTLAGNTLYRLTFDTSLLPEHDTSAWAVVRVRIRPDFEKIDAQRLLDAAASDYLRQVVTTNEMQYRTMVNNIRQECWHQEMEAPTKQDRDRHQEKKDKNWLPVANDVAQQPLAWRKGDANPTKQAALDREEEAAFRRVLRCASKDMPSISRRLLERELASWMPSPPPSSAPSVRNRFAAFMVNVQVETESKEAAAARQATSRLWAEWLGTIFDSWIRNEFNASALSRYRTLSLSSGPGPFPYKLDPIITDSTATKNPPGSNQLSTEDSFKAALKHYAQSSVYAVTPRQTVQDLSEVSSNKKAAELLLGLSAIASSAGVNAAIQSIKANTAQYEAIRRQPLVVGFTENGHICTESATDCQSELVFGWLFGPAFSISNDGKSAQFRHVAQQRAVAAQLSVPAWLQSLGMTVETSWRKENGEVVGTAASGQGAAAPVKYQVRLPANGLQSLDTLETMAVREPRVDQYQFINVMAGEPATVLITGRNLGYETMVFLGSQQAKLVTLLPGNRGVVAHFDRVAPPHGMAVTDGYNKETPLVELSVHTAMGRVLAGRVAFISESVKDKAKFGTDSGADDGAGTGTAQGTQPAVAKSKATTAR